MPANLPRDVNPKKWAFDPDAGEFFRITSRSKEGYLVETKGYAARMADRMKARRTLRVTGPVAVLLWGAFLYALTLVWGGFDVVGFLMLLGAGMLALAVTADLLEPLDDAFFNDVGPVPVSPHGDESEDKNVHGEGGYATREDIARAARGFTRGLASQQEFED